MVGLFNCSIISVIITHHTDFRDRIKTGNGQIKAHIKWITSEIGSESDIIAIEKIGDGSGDVLQGAKALLLGLDMPQRAAGKAAMNWNVQKKENGIKS